LRYRKKHGEHNGITQYESNQHHLLRELVTDNKTLDIMENEEKRDTVGGVVSGDVVASR
jgi:hypothetical protein